MDSARLQCCWALVVLAAVATTASAGQPPDESKEYFGRLSRMTPEIRSLLAQIESAPQCPHVDEYCDTGTKLKNALFPDYTRHQYADLIVYVHQDESGVWRYHRPLLMADRNNTPHLWGAKSVYAIVIARKKEAGEEPPPPLAVIPTVERRNVSSALRAALEYSNLKLPTPQSEPEEPKTRDLHWDPLDDAGQYWIGISKVRVANDSVGRITVLLKNPQKKEPSASPVTNIYVGSTAAGSAAQAAGTQPATSASAQAASPKKPQPQADFVSIGAHFSNSYADYFGLALAGGAVFSTGHTKLPTTDGNLAVGGFALLKVYTPYTRPRVNVGPDPFWAVRPSIAFVVGTNWSHRDDVTQLVYGVSVGHLLGPVGIMVGQSHVSKPDGDKTHRNMVAIDYTF